MRRFFIFSIVVCLTVSSVILSGCTTRANWMDVNIDKKVFDDAEPVYNDDYNMLNGGYDYLMNIARTDDAFYLLKQETRTETVSAPVYLSDSTFKTIYRTDKNGTKEVYDGKCTDYQGFSNKLIFYDGKLLDSCIHDESGQNEIYYLNEDKKQFEKLFTFEAPGGEALNYFEVVDGKLIFLCSKSSIYEYSDGEYKKLPVDSKCYNDDSYIYDYYDTGFYFGDINSETINDRILYKYDVNLRKTVASYDLGKVKSDGKFKGYEQNSVLSGNYMYIAVSETDEYWAHRRLYRVNLSNLTADFIFETDESFCINAVGDCAYVGFSEDKNGLYRITPESNELIELSSDSTAKIFIVDNKWIYFAGNRNDIKRVHSDGEGLETAIKVKTAS